MGITASDIITADEVAAVLEERTRAMFQFRRAFRDDDATDIDGSTKTFPVPDDTLEGDMTDIDEEANYPRSAIGHDSVDANYTKDGFEVAISDEAADDSVVNVILDVTEEMANAAEAHLDSQAYTVLNANRSSTTIGSGSNDLNYAAVVDAWTTLAGERYNPENFELYASSGAFGDLAKDETFTHATDEGDALARAGMLGEVFGTNVAMTNTGDLADGEAFLVDTGIYGYESTRWDREVRQYRDEEHDRDVFKVRVRNDFVATNSDACLKLAGGVSTS